MLKTIRSLGIILAICISIHNAWADCASPAVSGPQQVAQTAGNPHQIDLNSASVDELMQLNGIGRKKAEAIIDYRMQHHGFQSIDELEQVKGIGKKLVERNRHQLQVFRSGTEKFSATPATPPLQAQPNSSNNSQILMNTSY